jgi:uncharacterized damage-inducible protein DinB
MRGDAEILETVAQHAITGSGAHVETGHVYSGVDWKAAGLRPDGAPHSLYQLLNHTIFWQEWVLKWLKRTTPRVPKHASGSWRGGVAPATRADWERAVRRFQRGLAQLERHSRKGDLLSTRGRKSRLEMLQTIGAHSSYHAGQATLLRQILGHWPPPGGGLTW